MAKITEDALCVGRRLLEERDPESFFRWTQEHAPTLLTEKYRQTFQEALRWDSELALKLFDRLLPMHDEVVERTVIFVRLAFLLFVSCGVVGGVVYLVRLIFEG